MTLRNRILITALFLCHPLLASALVTSQLPPNDPAQSAVPSSAKAAQKVETSASASSTACAKQAATQDSDSATICADQQKKVGNVYKLQGHAEIHYRNYVLRADEVTYDSDSGEATTSGRLGPGGGPNDDSRHG